MLPGPVPSDFDLAGRQYDDVVVVRYLRTEGRRGRVWLCECQSCGRTFERETSAIARRARNGVSWGCPECALELSRARRASSRDIGFWKRLWDRHRDLYSPRSVGAPAPWDAVPKPSNDVMPAEGPPSSSCASDRNKFLGAYLHPISAEGGWRCGECSGWFGVGYGCVRCLEPICSACVASRRHRGCSVVAAKHTDPGRAAADARWVERVRGGFTLREIARVYRRLPERIRQVESGALRKLRSPGRLKHLRDWA